MRLVLVAALGVAAYYAATYLSTSLPISAEQSAVARSAAPAPSPAAERPRDLEAPAAVLREPPAAPGRLESAASSHADAGLAPPPVTEPHSVSVTSQPISIVVTAPEHIANGSTFEVSVGVPSGRGIYAARFSLAYDDDALEVLDITDATGAAMPAVTSERGRIDLDLDAGRGAKQAPAIRFLARTAASREVQLTVAVELRDQVGNVLPSAPVPSRPISVDP